MCAARVACVRVSPRKYGVLAPPSLPGALALRLSTWPRQNAIAAAGASRLPLSSVRHDADMLRARYVLVH